MLALAIDGAVGQVASVVHGFCDWYNTGSYLVRRLNESGIVVDRAEVRRLTNAALMSKGRAIDERALDPVDRAAPRPELGGPGAGRCPALRVLARPGLVAGRGPDRRVGPARSGQVDPPAAGLIPETSR